MLGVLLVFKGGSAPGSTQDVRSKKVKNSYGQWTFGIPNKSWRKCPLKNRNVGMIRQQSKKDMLKEGLGVLIMRSRHEKNK